MWTWVPINRTLAETCQVFTLVIDRGKIVERGTHSKLLEPGGLYGYAQLYETALFLVINKKVIHNQPVPAVVYKYSNIGGSEEVGI